MEHLHVPAGHLLAAPGTAGREFYRKAVYDGVQIRGVIAPTAAARNRHRLLATSIAIESASFSFGTPFLGWPPPLTFGPIRLYRRLRDGHLSGIAQALKRNVERASSVSTRLRTWTSARAARSRAEARSAANHLYSLYFRSEQAPDPDSRVDLSERHDALGVPESRLHWRVNPVDTAAITGWLEMFDRDIRARGLGAVIAPAEGWQREIIGGPHHMGTTRMAIDARHGVVDAHCRVHSVDNLYVAGSSVFATGGYANPTFTLVALALRLADTLRVRLRGS
jgi:choline dehydrogenase-like flavoprotein